MWIIWHDGVTFGMFLLMIFLITNCRINKCTFVSVVNSHSTNKTIYYLSNCTNAA